MLKIPIVKEEHANYIDIINLLGTFVSRIIKNVLNVNVTIASFSINPESKEKLGYLRDEDESFIIKYSEEFGKIFNAVKHNPDKLKGIGFDKTKKFIDDSHKVLDIVLKNKQKFH